MDNLTIKEIKEGLAQKKFSAQELTANFLKKIESRDPELKAFLSIRKEAALEEAKKIDQAGHANKPLAGIPIALKDNLLIKGEIATAGSKILENYTASYDATVVSKLKEAGAVILGKTNLDEFAMGSSTENSAYQTTHNPHDLERVPGGSSGGSAAAVAADLAVAALGSDTGGSIRQPAALTGTVGLKPTYGMVSRSGLMAMASSLDQIGPFAKTVSDARLMLEAIKGSDPLDSTSNPKSDEDLRKLSPAELKILKIGIPEEYFGPGLSLEVGEKIMQVKKEFEELGIQTKSVTLPNSKYAISTYYIIMPAEVSSNLARFDGIRYERYGAPTSLKNIYHETRGRKFGKEVKRRIILGTFVLSSGYYDAYYGKAEQVRSLIQQDFLKAFEDVDIILAPTTPTSAFKIGEKSDDPLAMYLSDIYTVPANLAGLPAISIPCRDSKPLPIGFQLIGPHFHESEILSLGEAYEEKTPI